MKPEEEIELIQFIYTLDLDWEERLSLQYSSGLYTYWEIYHSYKRQKVMREIISYVPLIAVIGVASAIVGIVEKVLNKEKVR